LSKLNEEILDTLYCARQYQVDLLESMEGDDKERHARMAEIHRLDRVWDYFQAQRTIEDYRKEEV